MIARTIAIASLMVVLGSAASAQPDAVVFRAVSFICRESPSGAQVKIEENVLGHRKRYDVTYLQGRATLFVISKSRDGRNYRRVALIDMRVETNREKIEAADYLTSIMAADGVRYCKGSRRAVLAARYELQANHIFNRSHPGYRGK